MSWVAIDDVVGRDPITRSRPTSWPGVANTVAPNPVTNAEFTKTLGRVLGRPTLFAGARARPARSRSASSRRRRFRARASCRSGCSSPATSSAVRELEPALRHVLGR